MVWQDTRRITSAYASSTVKMGVSQAMLMLQDGFTECFGRLGSDNVAIGEKYNAFWVLTKTKLHFYDLPDWGEDVLVRTFPIDNKMVRTHVCTEILSLEGNVYAASVQEMCVLDRTRHRPVKLSMLNYPTEGFPECTYDKNFEKFPTFDRENADNVIEQQVFCEHIDMSRHMNNVEYVRLAMNTFSLEFIHNNIFTDVETHYLGECREGQLLRVYRYAADDHTFYCNIYEGERLVFEMKMLTLKR